MKARIAAAVLAFACLPACQDQAAPAAAIPTPASKAPATEPARAYQVVETLIKEPAILEQSWPQMRGAFPAGCSNSQDGPELACPPVEGIVRLSVTASGTGMVDAVFAEPVQCERLYEVVSKRYGAGQVEGGNRCAATWKLQWGSKRGQLRLSRGKKDAGKIFLQMAMEQGP